MTPITNNTTAAAPGTSAKIGGIDLDALRVDQNFAQTLGEEKVLSTVPVNKPKRDVFFRVHPDPAWTMIVASFAPSDSRDVYLVTPSVAGSLPAGDVRPVQLVTFLI